MRGEREAQEGGVICILTVVHNVVEQKKTELDSFNLNSHFYYTAWVGITLIVSRQS